MERNATGHVVSMTGVNAEMLDWMTKYSHSMYRPTLLYF